MTPRGGEPEPFDEVVLATHSDQALALLADASDAERRLLGAIPYQANEAVLHTDTSIAAAAPARLGELELPPLRRARRARTTVTYHMNRLQSLRAEREFCVTLNRTDQIDPAQVIRTIAYAHPVYTREGMAAQRRVAEISGRQPHALLRRLLGLGLSRGRRGQRAARGRAFRGAAVTASCIYTGTIRHRRACEPRTRVHATGWRWPTSTSDELPSLLGGRLLARGPGALRFRRRDYLGPASLPLDVAVRDRVAELSGHRAAGPIRLLTQLRSFGLCFNPVSFYYCFDAPDERASTACWPRSPTRRGASATPTCSPTARRTRRSCAAALPRQLHVSPFMGMDHVYEARATPPGPDALGPHREPPRGRGWPSTPRWPCGAGRSRAAPWRG